MPSLGSKRLAPSQNGRMALTCLQFQWRTWTFEARKRFQPNVASSLASCSSRYWSTPASSVSLRLFSKIELRSIQIWSTAPRWIKRLTSQSWARIWHSVWRLTTDKLNMRALIRLLPSGWYHCAPLRTEIIGRSTLRRFRSSIAMRKTLQAFHPLDSISNLLLRK